jgi:hypothetical protein
MEPLQIPGRIVLGFERLTVDLHSFDVHIRVPFANNMCKVATVRRKLIVNRYSSLVLLYVKEPKLRNRVKATFNGITDEWLSHPCFY